ncbi:MAG TPA: VOC family protein [Anaeromyxobacteraceae bacterium]|nr:VOC family protein [Anaeromyxobacteraceae bacterium]
MDPTPPTLGLRHAALTVRDLAEAERFFVDVLGYRVEWRPDPENVYLVRAEDDIALHRGDAPGGKGMLDHLGLFVARAEDVDRWERHLEAKGARLLARSRTHRDGARSLYVEGPEGLVVQILHHPRAFQRPPAGPRGP